MCRSLSPDGRVVLHTLALCCVLTLGRVAVADEPVDVTLPSPERILETLREGHPRLLATSEDFERLADLCQTDPRAGRWLSTLTHEADELLTTSPVRYEIPDGKRLLRVSRRAKSRMLLLGLIYRLTGESRYADRLWQELQTVMAFQDWNPSHFLDTAEMTFAVAIGYDWGYDAWNAEQRAQCERAMITLGFGPGLNVYHRQAGWARSIHNWNQVCNGGLGVGALAIADAEPDAAREVLHSALQSLPRAMHEFRPDGGWGEGPGYWRYATEYNVYILAALQTALGTDFGLSRLPGFPVTGDFPIHFVGPTGETFNYADAHSSWSGAPQLFWLATMFSQPAYAAAQLPYANEEPSPLDLLWGARWLVENPEPVRAGPARLFQGVEVAFLRAAWNDPAALYMGFKGGDNTVNHGQLDLGTFVLEALGERWAVDLGSDDYNIPGYFGKQRWTYYRNSTAGHNTLLVDEQNQDTSATAAIIAFADGSANNGQWCGAVADLTQAYPQCRRLYRGVAMVEKQIVVVQDELQADEPVDVEWRMHTNADVRLRGKTAFLTQNGQDMVVRLIRPVDATFGVTEVTAEPPQKPLRDTRCLRVVLPNQDAVTVVVEFHPGTVDSEPQPVRPLSDWPFARVGSAR